MLIQKFRIDLKRMTRLTHMKKKLIIPILSTLIVFAACSGEQEVTQEVEELVKTVNVRTSMITPSNFNSFVRVVGTVETSDDIMISAEVSGKVTKYYVQEGESVRVGETIIKIDDAKLKQGPFTIFFNQKNYFFL